MNRRTAIVTASAVFVLVAGTGTAVAFTDTGSPPPQRVEQATDHTVAPAGTPLGQVAIPTTTEEPAATTEPSTEVTEPLESPNVETPTTVPAATPHDNADGVDDDHESTAGAAHENDTEQASEPTTTESPRSTTSHDHDSND